MTPRSREHAVTAVVAILGVLVGVVMSLVFGSLDNTVATLAFVAIMAGLGVYQLRRWRKGRAG